MFTITATQAITWPNLALLRGKNDFLTRQEIPAELWPKLDRFRSLGLLAFEGAAEAGKVEPLKLDGLTEQQIYNLDKSQLAELAKASGVPLGEDAKKKALVDALVAKLPKAETEPAVVVAEPVKGKATRAAVAVE